MKRYYEEHIAVERPHIHIDGATHRLYRFPNNYGASIVWGGGLDSFMSMVEDKPYELAIIRFIGGDDDDHYYLDYANGLTADVFRFQNEEQIRDLLKQIKNLEGVSV